MNSHFWFTPVWVVNPPYQPTNYYENQNGVCGGCRERVHPEAANCPHCGCQLFSPEAYARMSQPAPCDWGWDLSLPLWGTWLLGLPLALALLTYGLLATTEMFHETSVEGPAWVAVAVFVVALLAAGAFLLYVCVGMLGVLLHGCLLGLDPGREPGVPRPHFWWGSSLINVVPIYLYVLVGLSLVKGIPSSFTENFGLGLAATVFGPFCLAVAALFTLAALMPFLQRRPAPKLATPPQPLASPEHDRPVRVRSKRSSRSLTPRPEPEPAPEPPSPEPPPRVYSQEEIARMNQRFETMFQPRRPR